jgi:hypothetical protein
MDSSEEAASQVITGLPSLGSSLLDQSFKKIGGLDGWTIRFSLNANSEAYTALQGIISVEDHRRIYYVMLTAPAKLWASKYNCVGETILDSMTISEPIREAISTPDLPSTIPVEVRTYLVEYLARYDEFLEAARSLGQLIDDPKGFDEEWRDSLQFQTIKLRDIENRLNALSVPEEVTDIHNSLLNAIHDCSEAIPYAEKAYVREVNNQNPNDVSRISALLESCANHYTESQRLYKAYIADAK